MSACVHPCVGVRSRARVRAIGEESGVTGDGTCISLDASMKRSTHTHKQPLHITTHHRPGQLLCTERQRNLRRELPRIATSELSPQLRERILEVRKVHLFKPFGQPTGPAAAGGGQHCDDHCANLQQPRVPFPHSMHAVQILFFLEDSSPLG
jgi:hypothetical protein